jgi:hypothetical protein
MNLPNPDIGPEDQPTGYYEAVSAEDARLQQVLTSIREDEASGELTPRQAAAARIAAMETHLEKCQAHRRRYLGESS